MVILKKKAVNTGYDESGILGFYYTRPLGVELWI